MVLKKVYQSHDGKGGWVGERGMERGRGGEREGR